MTPVPDSAIVTPAAPPAEAPPAPVGASAKAAAAPPASLPADSAAVAAPDSVAEKPGEHLDAIIISPPEKIPLKGEGGMPLGMSWIMLALFALFITVCLRFKNNIRYLQVLWRNLTEVRSRHNLFDDTVRETTFLILINLLWCASAGVLLHTLVSDTWNAGLTPWAPRPPLPAWEPLPIALCMAVATLYTLFKLAAYSLTGNVFTDRRSTRMWVKGYAASQGLSGLVFFPLALLCLSYPGHTYAFLYVAGAVYIVAEVIFVWKGLRIFFNQFSSWVLFLYYLCSLEIVPLILTYVAAVLACAFLL